MMKKVFILLYILAPVFAFAEELSVSLKDEPFRGQPLVVSVTTFKNTDYFRIKWQDMTVEVPAEYDLDRDGSFAEVMLPTIYEKADIFPLEVTAISVSGGEQKQTVSVHVKDKDYPKESLTVEPKYVNPGKAALDRIARERPLSTAALKTFSADKLWTLPLMKPRNSAVSGVYGEQRVFNGEPRSNHGGVDFRGAVGEPILAVADGKVVLTGDFYYNGKFVFVDHGQGVITAYLHMSEMSARQGDDVKRGEQLGKVGATGRVTGPHLHFSLYVQGIAVDPMPLFE